ncbi:Flp pilus assembly complex ATPase component TadA [Patescibacteria group bacterium]|nr:Flp pilus assembly complex ATPase component TadA [Patescibacteria group bacterium]
MLYTSRLKEILLRKKLINKQNIELYEQAAKKEKLSLEGYLFKHKILEEKKLYKIAAEYFKLPTVDLKEVVVRKDILFLVPDIIASTHKILAFNKKGNKIQLAVTNPDDIQMFEFISKKTGLNPELYICLPSALEETLKQYRVSLKAEFQKITVGPAKKEDKKKLQQLAENLPIVRIVDSLLEHAIFEGASDIHIEPLEKEVVVRYRVDGILRKVMTLPRAALSGIVARIKILSNLKLDEHRLPQDGRFKVETKEYKISFRVSIMPIFDGEKIVMRLLKESAKALTLEDLGLLKGPLEIVKRNIKRPHGIIFVTGPTGSGKTTTLYSIMNMLNKPEVNIATVEDPVEYRMPGINQSQVNPKIEFTFAKGLRSLLRQDPDIMMVGEIRDPETAEIATNAAMTGHLVLSTLHTNDAATTLPRLGDMGVPPFLIAFTANMLVAQRLLRKLCPECKTSYKLTKEQVAELNKLFNMSEIAKSLQRLKFLKAGARMSTLPFYRGTGCQKCGNTGYKGRIGIYEVLEVTQTIKNLIHKKANAVQIGETAKKSGMITMVMDGFIKAMKGITSVEEVIRVTKE